MATTVNEKEQALTITETNQQRFPHYGWEEQHPDADDELHIQSPMDTQLDGLH